MLLGWVTLDPPKVPISKLSKLKTDFRSKLVEFYRAKDLDAVTESSQTLHFSKVLSSIPDPLGFLNVHVCRSARTAFARALLGVEFCSKINPKFRRARVCPACASTEFDLWHYICDCPKFQKDRTMLLDPVLAGKPGSFLKLLTVSSKIDIARIMLFTRRLEKFFEAWNIVIFHF